MKIPVCEVYYAIIWQVWTKLFPKPIFQTGEPIVEFANLSKGAGSRLLVEQPIGNGPINNAAYIVLASK